MALLGLLGTGVLALLAAAGGGVVSACGGASVGAGGLARVEQGDSAGAPSMLSLPSGDIPRARLSERMRFAWTLAEEALGLPMPPAPPGDSTRELSGWADGALATWLERKSHTVEAARRELDGAAEENHRQRIMAGAIVGLLYEDVARQLLTVPLPRELRDDAEIVDIFREVRRAQADPFIGYARRAYRACAANAAGGAAAMAHWAPYCEERAGRLP